VLEVATLDQESALPAGPLEEVDLQGKHGMQVHSGLSTTVEGAGTALRLDRLKERSSFEVSMDWSLK
jgi:hypothetical protein